MSQPTKRSTSANWQFRQRVPKDIVDKARGQWFEVIFPAHNNHPELSIKTKFGEFVSCSLGTIDKRLAIERCARADIEYFACCDKIRNNTSTTANPEIRSTAKRLFDYFHDDFSNADEPVEYDWLSVDGFQKASDWMRPAAIMLHRDRDYKSDDGRYSLLPVHFESFDPNDRSLNAMESRYGVACNWSLAWLKLRVKNADRYQLLCDFEFFLNQARNEQVRRKASIRFNNVSDNDSSGPVSFQKIFDEWVRVHNPKFNSKNCWRGVLKRFVSVIGHDDASKVTSFDIQRWKDTFTADSKPSMRTAQIAHFPCIRRMYAVAIEARWLSYNPAADLRVTVKNINKERVIPYTTAEMATILTAARQQDKPYRKWLPILTAITGARIGELGQLWQEQVQKDSNTGIWYLDIRPSPDGGYIKTDESERKVPIHRGILNEFLQFCETRKGKPLFYDKVHVKSTNPNDKEKVHPGQNFSGHLSKWYRTLDVDLNKKKPNHSMRHYFKSAGIRAKVSMHYLDAIQGHTLDARGSSDDYKHLFLDNLLEAIESIPFPTISVPADMEHATGSNP